MMYLSSFIYLAALGLSCSPWDLLLQCVAQVVLLIKNPPVNAAAAAAKSLQSCLTLCDPIDSSPPGSPVHRILWARTLEWVAISFSTANAEDMRDSGLIPGSGRSPGGGHSNPLQYSCLENPMDRGAPQAGYSPWGHKELDTTEATHTHTHTHTAYTCGPQA